MRSRAATEQPRGHFPNGAGPRRRRGAPPGCRNAASPWRRIDAPRPWRRIGAPRPWRRIGAPRFWLACAALCLATSCFAYRSGALPRGGGLAPGAEASDRTIAVSVRVRRTVNGEDREIPASLRESWIRATLDAYRASGLFDEVARGIRRDADLQAEVSIEDDVVGSQAFSYLSAMTWLILPSRSRDQLNVTTTYSVPGGEVVGQFRSKEVVTTWFQVFLLPLTPFGLRDRVVRLTVRDLSRATAARGRDKGIF